MLSRLSNKLPRSPWPTLLPLLLPLPFLLSGAVRFTLGTSLGVGLLICCLAAAAALLAARKLGLPRLTSSSTNWGGLATFVATGVLVACTFRLWWNTPFQGLPNTHWGVDVGNHAKLFLRFVFGSHKQYEGFVGMYALMHWWRQLLLLRGLTPSAGVYYALRFAHYVFLLSIPLALSLVVHASVARLRTLRQHATTLLLSLPVQLGVLAVVIFPVTQYYQAEGFYSQIAGLYPCLMMWVFYGLVEDVRARFILCAFWLVVQRFSYGLNLGDALIAFGYLTIWEAGSIKPAWLRWGARLFVPVAFAGAYLVDSKLYALKFMHGYYINQPLYWTVPTQLALALALVASPSALTAAGIAVSDASRRMWSYAGIFGLVNATLTAVYFVYDNPVEYYIMKYGLYAVVMMSIAAVGPISAILAHILSGAADRSRWRAQARVIVAVPIVAAIAVVGFYHGYEVYRLPARERFERPIPNVTNFSHFERPVDSFIVRTLEQKKAKFGGYYDPFWPRMFLANTLRRRFSDLEDFYYNGDFKRAQKMFVLQPGHCYFVLEKPVDYHGDAFTPLQQQLGELYGKRQDCTAYRPTWGTRDLTVCSTCL